MIDELEPGRGVYDWDLAFAQNPDEPVYEVPEEMRTRVQGVPSEEWAPRRGRLRSRLRAVLGYTTVFTACMSMGLCTGIPGSSSTLRQVNPDPPGVVQIHRRRYVGNTLPLVREQVVSNRDAA